MCCTCAAHTHIRREVSSGGVVDGGKTVIPLGNLYPRDRYTAAIITSFMLLNHCRRTPNRSF